MNCGAVIEPQADYCEGCRDTMPFITGERCENCGEALKTCTCRKHRFHYQSVIAPFYYEGGAKRAVLKLKQYPVYALPLAKECKSVIEMCYGSEAFDFVCCVPMHPKKQRQSGFNQSEALAREIAKQIGVPFVPALKALFETKPQHSLGNRLRAGNVRGVYDVMEECQVKNKSVLLVDDIKTSGATLNECALMLQLNGARSVRCVVAAIRKTQREGN